MRPDGEWSRRVSPSVALNSPEESQGAAAAVRAEEVVRRMGVAGASFAVEVSMAKTARSGEAKAEARRDWSLMFTGSW